MREIYCDECGVAIIEKYGDEYKANLDCVISKLDDNKVICNDCVEEQGINPYEIQFILGNINKTFNFIRFGLDENEIIYSRNTRENKINKRNWIGLNELDNDWDIKIFIDDIIEPYVMDLAKNYLKHGTSDMDLLDYLDQTWK